MDPVADVVPDRLLLRGMARGNRWAGGELQRRHAKSLYALAYGMLWDSEGAEAVVVRVFDHARRSASEFDTAHGTVFRWLAGHVRLHAALASEAAPPLTAGSRGASEA